MKKLASFTPLLMIVLLFSAAGTKGQTRTVGVMINNSGAMDGYILFSPKHYPYTYLINNEGRIINKWTKSIYEPGQSVYLLENGHLLRSCMTKGKLGTGGGEGGRIEEYDWEGNLVWEMDISTDNYMQHHDIRMLPNGNVIVLAVEKKTYAEVIAAGFNPTKMQPDIQQKGYMLPDAVYEIKPTYPSGGTIVWSWHVWDHLIQDYDAAKSNYGVVRDHPELIDCAGDQKEIPQFWNHMNSIDYNPALDQIMLSVRNNSEVWIIDHSTTTTQAAGHTGGKSGKGGDLLYRWGNPVCYRMGTSSDQKLYQQHDAEWIKPGFPGEGNVTVFNNGLGRNYSSVEEFTPPVDGNGNYSRAAGAIFGPSNITWSWVATPPSSMYAAAISGAYRLQNGNTMVDDGTHGTFYEVTASGIVVWKYICPVVLTGPLTQGDAIPDDPARAGEKMNAVFRIYKYPPTYGAFTGRTLTPGDYVEKYSPTSAEETGSVPQTFQLMQNYPNPFNPSTTIRYSVPPDEGEAGLAARNVTITVYDLLGREVALLVNEIKAPGVHSVQFDASELSAGTYFYSLKTGEKFITKKMVLLK